MPEHAQHRFIDLFAGCGGLTAGFVHQGQFRPVGAVERDADAAATYTVNFGEHVAVQEIESWAKGPMPLAEVVLGGPPCQGFSAIGRRDSSDPRNAMWTHYVEVVRRVRPAFFVLENVVGFLASQQYRWLEAETDRSGRLAQYDLEAHVLDASWYGAAQARKRVFVVGRPAGMRKLGAPPAHTHRALLGDALKGVQPRVVEVDLPTRSSHVLGRSVQGPFRTSELHLTVRASDTTRTRWAAVPPGGGRLDLPMELRLPAWRRDYRGSSDVMGRLRWEKPASTLRTEFFRPEKGRFLHPDEDRPLTHLEAARLQGFPDEYQWCGSKAAIARQIGNAVPVPLAAALATHLAAHLK